MSRYIFIGDEGVDDLRKETDASRIEWGNVMCRFDLALARVLAYGINGMFFKRRFIVRSNH